MMVDVLQVMVVLESRLQEGAVRLNVGEFSCDVSDVVVYTYLEKLQPWSHEME